MAYEYDRVEREDGGGSFLMGLLAGTVLGAGLGMLFAPKAGAETRRQVMEEAKRLRSTANDSYGQATDKVSQIVDRGRDVVDRGIERGREVVDRSREAVDRGRDAYDRARTTTPAESETFPPATPVTRS